jgi:hypothetical protein
VFGAPVIELSCSCGFLCCNKDNKEKCSMEISTEKTKIMAYCGKEPVPIKICLNNKILQRVNEFNYLGCKLPFVGELDLPGKISKYSKTMGIINNVLKPSLVQKHTRIRMYKTLSCPPLCNGSEHGLYEKVLEVELQTAR